MYEGVKVQLHEIFPSALDEEEWPVSVPGLDLWGKYAP
jgi:hypothetical protein